MTAILKSVAKWILFHYKNLETINNMSRFRNVFL